MRRFLFDTTVFLYATGSEHPYREPCREIVRLAAARKLRGEISVELIHEFVHYVVRRRKDARTAYAQARQILAACTAMHSFELSDLDTALILAENDKIADFRDAIFIATATNREIDAILSADRDFDGTADIERIDPGDFELVLAKLGDSQS